MQRLTQELFFFRANAMHHITGGIERYPNMATKLPDPDQVSEQELLKYIKVANFVKDFNKDLNETQGFVWETCVFAVANHPSTIPVPMKEKDCKGA